MSTETDVGLTRQSRDLTTADALVSTSDLLEAAVARARSERADEVAAVEHELARMARVYERLRGDLDTIREERDRALDAVREERERRERGPPEAARPPAELSRRDDDSRPVDATDLRERFVAERLAAAPTERITPTDGTLPDVPGFEILEPIGRGGMATVYRARRRSDGIAVAVKLLLDGADSSAGRTELFLREAAVMLQLDHPGLVAALDAGECAYGRYLVMELVEGESLSARVRREGPMPEADVLDVAVQLARALAYCARLGLTHRDVKPSNALLSGDGRVRLCDFGLAALSSSADPARPYGSPGYASPEQLATPTDVDERADIYGLGCTLWQLVVGRRPFPGPPRKAFDDARAADLTDPRFDGADITPGLARIIRRMARSDRAKRYRRWDECLMDLILVQQGHPPFSAHFAEARESTHGSLVYPPDVEFLSADVDGRETPGTPYPTEPVVASPDCVELAPPEAPTVPAPPATQQPPAPRSRAAFWAAVGAAALFGCGVAWFLRHDPVAEMQERARILAESGRAAEAARCLRVAAEIAPPDVAARLRRDADAIEKK